MDAVHIRGDDEPSKNAIQSEWKPKVAVVEHRGGIENDLEEQNGDHGRSEQEYHSELDGHGEQNLDGVEPEPGRYIELEVGVVHAMNPPECGNGVKQDVLTVDGQIEHEQR